MTYDIEEVLLITERVIQQMNPRPSSSTAINNIAKKAEKYSKWKLYSKMQQKYRVAVIADRVLMDIKTEKTKRRENRKRRKAMREMYLEPIAEPIQPPMTDEELLTPTVPIIKCANRGAFDPNPAIRTTANGRTTTYCYDCYYKTSEPEYTITFKTPPIDEGRRVRKYNL